MKSTFLFLALLCSLLVSAQVTTRDTLISWRHFDYSLNENYGLADYSDTEIVDRTFNGIVIENSLIKACLIPEFGGRIISIVYKPTGKEQLYQNPIGVPYEIGNGIFYHDWLMVYGGIFPTFPEPEHGKYWITPWNYEVKENTSDKVSISMWLTDNQENPRKPGQYNNGVTGITCYFEVSLSANSPSLDVDVSLQNNGSASVFEYWTCITFAPGSEIGNTYSPSNSEMIVPIDRYTVAWNLGNWMNSLDERSESDPGARKYEKLAHLSNWKDMGIAYASPSMTEPYYGVINHENEQGLFRISDDQSTTPGLKFWTWGDARGSNADPNDFNTSARPYIELWSGTPIEFFQDTNLGANESIEWRESYFPTYDMENVSYVDRNTAFYGFLNEEVVNINVCNPALSSSFVEIYIEDREENRVWEERLAVPVNTTASTLLTWDLEEMNYDTSDYTVSVSLWNSNEMIHEQQLNQLGERTLSIPSFDPEMLVLNGSIQFQFVSPQKRTLLLFDLKGKMIARNDSNGLQGGISYPEKGIYIIVVNEGSKQWTKKIQIR